MFNQTISRAILIIVVGVLIIGLYSNHLYARTIPAVGSRMPDFLLQTPQSEAEREYLGIENRETFSIDQVKCEALMIEIIGVYCPQCHIQLPRNTELFYRIKKDSKISEKIKILGIAIGATPTEVSYLKRQFHTPYPIITDSQFEIHKLLGEPRTPFTLLINGGSNIVFSHLGVIKDMDSFFLEIKKLVP